MPQPCAVDTSREQSLEATTRDAQKVAEMVHRARHVVVFTGAGISTSAAIPDFRGPNGVWTCRDAGRAPPACIALEQAIPTSCHDMLKRLVEKGTVKYIVSQNVDGLHRRSGVPSDRISELHGNSFLDVCWGCGADNEHASQVPSGANGNAKCAECLERVPHFCHCTGETCRRCGGNLRDSIIHFGESLPEVALQRAYQHARRADLCIVLGSSLSVSPANEIPKIVADKRDGDLVIVNLQPTDLDARASLLVPAKTDRFAELFESALDALAHAHDDGNADGAASEAASLRSATTIPHAVRPLPSLKFALCNSATPAVGLDGYFDWVVFLAGFDVQSNRLVTHNPACVRRVHYKLHPTFPRPEVTMDRPSSASDDAAAAPFVLVQRGWGTFTVGAVVELEDGREVRLRHELCFDPGMHVGPVMAVTDA